MLRGAPPPRGGAARAPRGASILTQKADGCAKGNDVHSNHKLLLVRPRGLLRAYVPIDCC